MSLTIAEIASLSRMLADLPGPPRVVLGTGSRKWPDDDVMVSEAVAWAFEMVWVAARPADRVTLVVGDARGTDQVLHNAARGTGWWRPRWHVDGPWAPVWAICTPICPDDGGKHRKTRHPEYANRGNTWCPLAAHWRNQRMVDHAVKLGRAVCLGFSWNESGGTADCLRRARAAQIPTWTFARHA